MYYYVIPRPTLPTSIGSLPFSNLTNMFSTNCGEIIKLVRGMYGCIDHCCTRSKSASSPFGSDQLITETGKKNLFVRRQKKYSFLCCKKTIFNLIGYVSTNKLIHSVGVNINSTAKKPKRFNELGERAKQNIEKGRFRSMEILLQCNL